MSQLESLLNVIKNSLEELIVDYQQSYDELTIECHSAQLINLMVELKQNPQLDFSELIDLCAIDYLMYGKDEWETETATERGYSRGVENQPSKVVNEIIKQRFAVVYHLLSIQFNYRLRVKVFLSEESLFIASVHNIWKAANWFEREAYDLYGILFEGHPDLRRILTDYGFIGHPFRKDFPLIGEVEMHYNASLEKVVYAPVDIAPRILTPKVIRKDNRYLVENRPNHE